jgi:hypothetical protein
MCDKSFLKGADLSGAFFKKLEVTFLRQIPSLMGHATEAFYNMLILKHLYQY